MAMFHGQKVVCCRRIPIPASTSALTSIGIFEAACSSRANRAVSYTLAFYAWLPPMWLVLTWRRSVWYCGEFWLRNCPVAVSTKSCPIFWSSVISETLGSLTPDFGAEAHWTTRSEAMSSVALMPSVSPLRIDRPEAPLRAWSDCRRPYTTATRLSWRSEVSIQARGQQSFRPDQRPDCRVASCREETRRGSVH